MAQHANELVIRESMEQCHVGKTIVLRSPGQTNMYREALVRLYQGITIDHLSVCTWGRATLQPIGVPNWGRFHETRLLFDNCQSAVLA